MRTPRTTAAGLSVLALALAAGAAACSDEPGGTAGTSSSSGSGTAVTTATSAPSTTTSGETVAVDVYFVDQEAFNVGAAPFVEAVRRDVPIADPLRGALDALFEGPTTDEANDSLILVTSGATGVRDVVVDGSIARVYLDGACSSGGSTMTVANMIVPTVMQFEGIEAVKIYDPEGTTEEPDGVSDSIPVCLEP